MKSSRRMLRHAASTALALLFLLPGQSGQAQSNFGSLRGQVRDTSGNAVAGATVRITDVGTNAEVRVTTGDDGQYVAPGLRPVTYNITVEARGFRTTAVTNIKVDTARDVGVDVELQPGEVTDTVTVSGESPIIQTESGAVSQTVATRTIVDTPLNGRNVLELALTLPGVTGAVGSEFANGGRAGTSQFYADGMNVTSIGLARTSVSFSPDTIQEFSVLQSNYSAQYSQAGGGIIQQTTKSGTNEFHGTLYWFHRQKALSANPFRSQRNPLLNNDNRSPLRRQQLGATVGGPVWLPKKYFGPASYDGRNRTFFFFSYEPTRQLVGSAGGASFERVPTDLELQGDFSQSFTYDAQGTRLPYPLLYNHFVKGPNGALLYRPNPNFNAGRPVGPTNPLFQYVGFPLFNPNDPDPARRGRVLVDANGVSYVNPVAARIARELYPRPNIPIITSGDNAGANFVYFRQTRNTDDRYTVRLDQRLGNNHSLNGRYTYQPLFGDRFVRDPETQPGTSDTSKSRQVLVNWTGSFRPTLVNELRAGYVFGNFARNFPSNFLTQDVTTKYLDIGGPGRGTPNFLGFGSADFFSNGGPAGNARTFGRIGMEGIQNVARSTEHIYSINDDLTWTRGAQTLKLGFAANHQQFNTASPGYGYLAGGRWNAGTNTTADSVGRGVPGVAPGVASGNLPSDARDATARTGDQFASFLVGVPSSLLAYDNIAQPYYYRWLSFGGYAQDDWKVRPNVTLNLGLRYQYQSPRWEKFNRQGQLNLDRLEPNPFALDAQGRPQPAPVFEFAGYNGRSRYLTPPQYKDFEPRFGFAWTPGFGWNKGQRLVVRGGYGITHQPLTGRNRYPFPNLGSRLDAHRAYNVAYGSTDLFNNANVGGCGLAICTSDPRVPGQPYSNYPAQFGFNNVVYEPDPTLFIISKSGEIRPGDIGKTLNGVGLQDRRYNQGGFVFDRNFRTPTTQNYSLEIQYEIMPNTAVTIGYQGSRGTHLFNTPRDINVNPFTSARAVPGWTSSGGRIILMDETSSASTYHAAKVDVERRFAAGLQFRFNYTFSKLIDNASGGIEFDFGNLAGQDRSAQQFRVNSPQNSLGTTSERAVSSYDTPHVFNLTALYELPFGRGKWLLNDGGFANHVVGDWQLTVLARLRSGQPVYADLGNGNNLSFAATTGLDNPRPNLVPGVPLRNPDWTIDNAPTTPYLNPRAFTIQAPATFGNAPRTFAGLRMPWVRTFDASLFKSIRPFGERGASFQFRLEVFNVFNRKNYGFNATSLFTSLAQNAPGQPNRYANLTPQVWTAIINRDPAGLTGDATAPMGQTLSPLGVYNDLVNRYNRSFYAFGATSQNVTAPRIIQLALKFYF
jgi:hypothetical protein